VSPKLPRVTATEMLRALHRDGWYDHAQEGSHLALKHPVKTGRVTLPMHRRDLNTRTVSSILKQAGLTADELRRLL